MKSPIWLGLIFCSTVWAQLPIPSPLPTETPKRNANSSPQSGDLDVNAPIPSLIVASNGVPTQVLKNARIKKVYPDGITFIHDSGMSKVPFEKLPKEFQTKFGYDEKAAKEYSKIDDKRQQALSRELQQQAATAQKEQARKDAAFREKDALESAQKAQQNRANQIERSRIAAAANEKAEADKLRATALRQMERAMKSGDRRDEAKALRMLQTDAPEAVDSFNQYLAAKAARARQSEDDRMRRQIDDISRRINGM